MISPDQCGIVRHTTPRRLLSAGALTIITVLATSVPASATCDDAHASASVLSTDTRTGVGYSHAEWDADPGPNTGGDITTIPASDYLDFGQGGGMQSVSTTTSPYDASAVSGFVGSDGQVTFDRTSGRFAPATVDLLALMRKGGADLSGSLVDEATLRFGLGGSELIAEDGEFLDPDGVGGPGQYRVGQADLDLHSPKIAEAAAMIYDAAGRMDQAAEDAANSVLSAADVSKALPGTVLTARVRSDMQDRLFRSIVAKPITSKNKVLTIDFSTGRATLHLDQALHGAQVNEGIVTGTQTVRPGDPTGLNSQNPNTELIDSEIYPMIAETVHDLMNEVMTIAIGAVEGALSSVTVDFTATQSDATGSGVATWSLNVGTGEIKPATCIATGLTGGVKCTLLTLAVATLGPVLNTTLVPVRQALIGNAGATLYRLAISDLKTGLITVPVRAALQPFFEKVAENVSVQLNSQRTRTCVAADGTRRTSAVELSALSLGLRRADAGPALGFGNSSIETKCDGTLL